MIRSKISSAILNVSEYVDNFRTDCSIYVLVARLIRLANRKQKAKFVHPRAMNRRHSKDIGRKPSMLAPLSYIITPAASLHYYKTSRKIPILFNLILLHFSRLVVSVAGRINLSGPTVAL